MNFGRPDQQPYQEDPFGLTDGRDWANSSGFVAPSNITPDGLQMSANTMSRIMAPESGTLLPEEPAPLNSFGDGNSAPYGTGRSATERMAQLPGSSVARDGATWQQALGIVNPINLVGLPFRFLKMVDRGVKTSLGRRTMADEATDAARYVDFTTSHPIPGLENGDQNQLPQHFDPKVQAYIRTKAGGQGTSEGMNPLPQLSESMWNLLTGEGFETERATIDAARQMAITERGLISRKKLGHELVMNPLEERQGVATARQGETKATLDERQLGDYSADRDLKRRYTESLIYQNYHPGRGDGGEKPITPLQKIQQRRLMLEAAGQGPPGPVDESLVQQRFGSATKRADEIIKTRGATSTGDIKAIYDQLGIPYDEMPDPDPTGPDFLRDWTGTRGTVAIPSETGFLAKRRAQQEEESRRYLEQLDPDQTLGQRRRFMGVPSLRDIPSLGDIAEPAPTPATSNSAPRPTPTPAGGISRDMLKKLDWSGPLAFALSAKAAGLDEATTRRLWTENASQ